MRSTPLAALLLTVFATAADLPLPPLTTGQPAAGKRVAVTAPEYAGTQVHHLVALPSDWNPQARAQGKRWPVIVEYTGNLHPASGSTGEVEGAALGHGLSRGHAIWIVLPYVAADRRRNEVTWWGDVAATVAYAKQQVPRICYREESAARLKRLQGRPLLVTQGIAGTGTREFLTPLLPPSAWTCRDIDMVAVCGAFPNPTAKDPHNDRWLLRDSPAGEEVRRWWAQVLADTNKKPR
ncbi:MAG: hypothetical protein LW857_02455 [Verrucomicrobiae bacterium]|nr:hypothetical protein [Verrucomicrobiae bacterium]